MRIACGSDFHFEFYSELEWKLIVNGWTFLPDISYMILAGDIHVGARNVIEVLRYIYSVHHIHILYVPGNHEYYGSSFTKENDIFCSHGQFGGEFTILLQDTFYNTTEDVMFFGCMGNLDGSWKKISRKTHGNLNDFRYIEDFRDRVVYGEMERDSLIYNLSNSDANVNIVITHTMPSPSCVSPKYAGNHYNPCFANDWEREIVDYKPRFWICGHTHECGTVKIDNTLVIMNPYGYPTENLNWNWVYIDV